MDEATKKILKIRFMKLVLLLNADVMLFTCSVISFFLLHDQLRLFATLTFFVFALILGLYILRQYRETKQWLKKQTSTD